MFYLNENLVEDKIGQSKRDFLFGNRKFLFSTPMSQQSSRNESYADSVHINCVH